MKLQIAVDMLTPDELIVFFDKAKDWIDILELGTPYLLRYGTDIIPRLRKLSESVEILCDSKIMDAGYYEAKELYSAGADYVTVLAAAESSTLKEALSAAREFGKKIVADMICIYNIPKKVQELENLGVDILAVHTGVDAQKKGSSPLIDLQAMKRTVSKAQMAVAGGICLESLDDYLVQKPDIIIVGGAVFRAAYPELETKKMSEKIRDFKLD